MAIDPSTRVCARCGAEAADNDYCPHCGLHLAVQHELPTRADWERRNPGAPGAPEPPAPAQQQPSTQGLPTADTTPASPPKPPDLVELWPAPPPRAPASAQPDGLAQPAGAIPAPIAARQPVPTAVWAGTLLAVVGAVMLVIAIFLPIVSSYIHVGQNSLVEGANTKTRIIPFLAGALAIISGLVGSHTQRGRGPLTSVAIGGLVGLIAAIVDGTDHTLRTVTTINVLGQEAGTIEAGLGSAMYVAGVGGALAIVGALIWSANTTEW